MSSHHGALVLAAGKGTRMHSDKPKVLHTLLGKTMLELVVNALQPSFGEHIWAIIGHGAEKIRVAFSNSSLRFIEQTELLGTGHALMTALPILEQAGIQRLLVVNGDTPLLNPDTVADFTRVAEGYDIAFMTLTLPSPGAYGSVVRHNGQVAAIVEAKDYDENLYGPRPNEINTGLYSLNLNSIRPLVSRLTNTNKSGEYYITDLIGLAVEARLHVQGIDCGEDVNLLGVNSPMELSRSELLLRTHIAHEVLNKGVMLHAPESISIAPDVQIEPGVEIFGPCQIMGKSVIAAGAVIHPYTLIQDSTIATGAVIQAFSHLDGAMVGERCTVGPYARLRPGAQLEESAHVGNFVELKKTRLGKGSKANHLSYLGDAEIGANVNIGAGTITCNYDGINKHQTHIEDGAFIGSNTALVAPVTVGTESLVGAGSVITHDVPAKNLAIARGQQRNMLLRRKA